jgi:V/A-type H+-transporting ATPase subunit E
MSLESAVQAILEKGKAEADRILEEASAERERMLSEVRSEAAKNLAEVEARARQDAERKRVQALARAELESRKIVLAAQKEALDAVYAKALGRLATLSENAEFLLRLLKANEAEWHFGGKVYCASRDEAVVRKSVGSSFAGTIDCAGGVVIESGDGTRRVDLRYESILRDVWNDAVKEVAETLWPSSD